MGIKSVPTLFFHDAKGTIVSKEIGFMPEAKISRVHGKKFKGRTLTLIPMYHPAAGLYRGEVKQLLFDDFAKIPGYLKEVSEDAKQKEFENIEQIGLF